MLLGDVDEPNEQKTEWESLKWVCQQYDMPLYRLFVTTSDHFNEPEELALDMEANLEPACEILATKAAELVVSVSQNCGRDDF